MHTTSIDEYLVVREFLPYLQEDFKDIFYEITSTNFTEKEILEFFFKKYLGQNVSDFIHFCNDGDNIPDDAIRFQL